MQTSKLGCTLKGKIGLEPITQAGFGLGSGSLGQMALVSPNSPRHKEESYLRKAVHTRDSLGVLAHTRVLLARPKDILVSGIQLFLAQML